MSRVRFEGHVFPTGLKLNIRRHPKVKVRDQDVDYDMIFDLIIEDGVVTVDCDVENYGLGPRHGDHEYVPTEEGRFIADRSWTVMNRFLEYKKRGSLPLPLEQFPLLTI